MNEVKMVSGELAGLLQELRKARVNQLELEATMGKQKALGRFEPSAWSVRSVAARRAMDEAARAVADALNRGEMF